MLVDYWVFGFCKVFCTVKLRAHQELIPYESVGHPELKSEKGRCEECTNGNHRKCQKPKFVAMIPDWLGPEMSYVCCDGTVSWTQKSRYLEPFALLQALRFFLTFFVLLFLVCEAPNSLHTVHAIILIKNWFGCFHGAASPWGA